MDKRVLFLFVAVGVAIFLTSFVSADTYGVLREGTNQFVKGLEEIFGPLFAGLLGTDEFDDFLFTKILVLMLLFIVIFSVLKKVELFERVKGVPVIVSLIISLISVRFISEEGFLGGILLPYGVVGIAILTFLPFLIYFWFVHRSVSGGFGRRIAWVLYGVIFILVWLTRPAEFMSATEHWIYIFGILAVFLSFFFDDTIHGYFHLSDMHKFVSGADTRRKAHLKAEYLKLSDVPEDDDIRKRKKAIVEELRKLGSNLFY